MALRISKSNPAAGLQPRIKVWLEHGDGYAFGLGLSEILSAVDETGSIKEASARIGKSYRHVWSRVKEAEQTLGRRLVETRVGGAGRQRSELTDEARALVSGFSALRTRVREFAEQEFRRCFGR